jgi:hypothetical protein
VLKRAQTILEGITLPAAARPFAVHVGNRQVWRYDADPDAVVRWDEARGIVFIDEPGAFAPGAPARSSAAGARKAARRTGAKRRTPARRR